MQLDKLIKRVQDILKDENPKLVEEVCKSEFQFLLDHMKSNNMQPVNLIYWGKFVRNKQYDEFGRSRKHLFRFKKPNLQK